MEEFVVGLFLEKFKTNINSTQILNGILFLRLHGFFVSEFIGSGLFGITMIASNIATNQDVVIKQIIVQDHTKLENIIFESEVIKQVKSPFVINIHKSLFNPEESSLFFVLDYCKEGNLRTFLKGQKDSLTNEQIAEMFTKILKGLLDSHQFGVYHGDLKPENVLISSEGTVPRLTDFRQAYWFGKDGSKESQTYAAPEQHVNGYELSSEVDYFSAGMILYNMCGYYDQIEMAAMKTGNFPQISDKNHPELLKIAFSMMVADPKKRASPNQVISMLKQLLLTNGNTQPDVKNSNNHHAPDKKAAKLILAIPDYLSEKSRATKKQLGQFVYEKDEDYDNNVPRLGPYQFENQYVYIGQWKEGKRHGRGEQFNPCGSVFEGTFKNDCADGYGRLIHSDGDYYIGQWKEDKAQGKGRYSQIKGSTYTGDWDDDKQSGKGLETWQNGDRFEGDYVSGKKRGMGKFQWSNGEIYIGEFQDNKMHGKGSFTNEFGVEREGEWNEGKRTKWTDGND